MTEKRLFTKYWNKPYFTICVVDSRIYSSGRRTVNKSIPRENVQQPAKPCDHN